MAKILLIDYLNLFHRSNVSFGPQDSTKESFTIIYNFFRSLRATIAKFKPSKVFICLEGKNNFRYEIYEEYKANRLHKKASKSYVDINRQRDITTNLLQYLPLTTAYADRFEADDVIGALCDNLKDEEEVIIISSDSDFIQLLQKDLPNVKLFDPRLKEFVSPPEFHYLGWKILHGDKKTDNIPGLMSNNKALEMVANPLLLEEFLSIEENRSNFNINKKLIELSSVPDNELILISGTTNFEALWNEFMKMELKTLLLDKYWSSFKETFNSL